MSKIMAYVMWSHKWCSRYTETLSVFTLVTKGAGFGKTRLGLESMLTSAVTLTLVSYAGNWCNSNYCVRESSENPLISVSQTCSCEPHSLVRLPAVTHSWMLSWSYALICAFQQEGRVWKTHIYCFLWNTFETKRALVPYADSNSDYSASKGVLERSRRPSGPFRRTPFQCCGVDRLVAAAFHLFGPPFVDQVLEVSVSMLALTYPRTAL